jgi:hypothetical protein
MSPRLLQKCQQMMRLSDSLYSESLTINGVSLVANVSELKAENQLTNGGFVYTYGLRIVINKAKNIVPVIGQTVVYNSKPYRILTVESDIVSITVTCDSINK